MYLKIAKIIGISVAGCIVWNSLLLGAYHWQKAFQEWKAESWKVQKVELDYGYEPAEIALNMKTDLLKQMEKAIKTELTHRVDK